MAENKLKNDDIAAICEGLGFFKEKIIKLSINFGKNLIGEEGAEKIASKIKLFEKLKEFSCEIPSNNIGPYGA